MTTDSKPAGHSYPASQHRIELDAHGVERFKRNRIINDLVDAACDGRLGPGLNTVAKGARTGKYTQNERAELYRLIGYSVSGFGDCFPQNEEDDGDGHSEDDPTPDDVLSEELAKVNAQVAHLFRLLFEIEALDADDDKMSKVQFRGAVRELARRRTQCAVEVSK